MAAYQLEYVTSGVSTLSGDGIVVHVVNDSSVAETMRIVIYQNTGGGAVTAADSGDTPVTPTWMGSLAFTVTTSGEYWVQIQVSSEALVPRAAFERATEGTFTPVVAYEPGDFAVFNLARRRIF